MAQAAALLLLVPIGMLFVNWLATLALGSIELRAPMLFALGAISTLSVGLAASSPRRDPGQLAARRHRDATASPAMCWSAAPSSAALRPSTTGSRR